ncbi:TPA: hypothetical protein I3798_003207 [Enterobacter cloacae]|uniref:hypothetical protein n=1 Tax=Enterobacter TaxID=547 RepID=UPI001140C3E2|nr:MULTISPECIES: hypothetical protein [Enterobacter]HAS0833051.1 hypothetical protein [Enterobacter cloacae subsp. cloacae]EJD6658081.1 hypothetical protein [Enterobacter cloacae]EKX4050316.1 hypothetical protein [Enterobacter cloacae]NWJ81460.1 hypothetical protein [Enterobacter sp. SECR19-1250]HAS1003576.1 hypothetical protein [Enterobacter cloacae]
MTGFTGGEIAVFKPLLCVSDLVMVRMERFYFMIYVILERFCFNDSAVEARKKPRIGEVWKARSILK